MDPDEPRVRRRGFLPTSDSDQDPDHGDSAEGVTIRVRIIRPGLKARMVAAGKRSHSRSVHLKGSANHRTRHPGQIKERD